MFAAILQERRQVTLDIRQESMNALFVMSEFSDVSNPATVVESAIVMNEATSSDCFFTGEIKDPIIILRPYVSVLDTWPEWARPPSRRDLKNCTVTLTRL